MLVDAAELRTPRSAHVQPGSEPEPSLAGRSYTCTEASELGDSQRHIEVAGASQPTRPADARDPAPKAPRDPEEVPEKGSEKGRSDGGSERSEKPKTPALRLDWKGADKSVHGTTEALDAALQPTTAETNAETAKPGTAT
jgi:hypothetical protein